MVQINPDRLLSDLRRLREFGACGSGVVRPTLSPVDMEARHWLKQRMSDAGLDAVIDGVANVVGRSRHPGKALLIGSHSDTQPRGGWLDGALGVIYALEVARALSEAPATRRLAVDVASWSDEEATFCGFLGSRSFCGGVNPEVIARATNIEGERLADAIAAAGLDGTAPLRLEPGRYLGYLEAHIEQGPHLEAEGKRIGVVTDIVGLRDYLVVFSGQQNHAGTTPMALRKDAGAALIDFAYRLREAFRAIAAERTVWNIGRVAFDPGATSIIPGKAEMSVQIRDPDEARLDALEAKMEDLVRAAQEAGPVGLSLHAGADHVKAVAMDPRLQEHIAEAAERHAPGAWVRMPSGAGHDAQVIAAELPSAMLFVPSIGGISHDFAEDTNDEDIVLGCRVLASAAASILEAQ